jgi:hypothetical protein
MITLTEAIYRIKLQIILRKLEKKIKQYGD